jgi:hypothetical protein
MPMKARLAAAKGDGALLSRLGHQWNGWPAGTLAGSGQRKVTLVEGSRLEEGKAQMQGECATLIYAVAPRRPPPDALALHVQGLEQARQLMAAIVRGDETQRVRLPPSFSLLALWCSLWSQAALEAQQHVSLQVSSGVCRFLQVSAFASNGCSAILCGECHRVQNDTPPAHVENRPYIGGQHVPQAKSASARPPFTPQAAAKASSASATLANAPAKPAARGKHCSPSKQRPLIAA